MLTPIPVPPLRTPPRNPHSLAFWGPRVRTSELDDVFVVHRGQYVAANAGSETPSPAIDTRAGDVRIAALSVHQAKEEAEASAGWCLP